MIDGFAVPLKESRHGNHVNSQSSFERAPQSMEKRAPAALMSGLPSVARPARPWMRGETQPRDFPNPGQGLYLLIPGDITTDITVCHNRVAESDTK